MGGPWSKAESKLHINCLEALAAFLAVKCFLRDRRSVTVLLRMNNLSAVTYRYVNKLVGTVSQSLTAITKDLWLWCLHRDIHVTLIAEHLPGVQNTIADEESRVMKDRTDWKLNPEVFRQIDRRLGPLSVDLFASRLAHQLPRYFSWRPDPEAEAMNAFSQPWDELGRGRVCQPPMESGRQNPIPSASSESTSSTCVDRGHRCSIPLFWECYRTFPCYCIIELC